MSSSISLYFGKQIQKKMNEIKPMRVHTSTRPPPTSSKVFLMLYLGLVQKSPLDTLRDAKLRAKLRNYTLNIRALIGNRVSIRKTFAQFLRNETQNFSFFAHQFCAKKQQFAQ